MANPEQGEKIFCSGRSVQVVLNLDSPEPIARSSSVYDNEVSTRRMILAQTSPPILASARFNTIDVTTVIPGEAPGEKLRIGVRCQFLRAFSDYSLSGGKKVDAFEVKYKPAVKRANSRRSFRVNPTMKFEVGGSLQWELTLYQSGTNFTIHDLSLSGIALIVPRYIKDKETYNPLFKLMVGDRVKLIIMLHGDENPESAVISEAKVVRKNEFNSENKVFCGLEFMKLAHEYEVRLAQFVQTVQLYDLCKKREREEVRTYRSVMPKE